MRWTKGHDMKHLKTAGLCLVSMLVVGMALAGNAVATPLWLVCLEGTEGVTPTKYTSEHCTEAAKENKGKWESVEAKTSYTVGITQLTLTLKDTKTLLGEAEVRCDSGGSVKGIVGPGNKAEVTSNTVEKASENCRGLKICEEKGVEKVEGVDLPWKTELSEAEGAIRAKLEGTGGGAGWKINCKTSLGSMEDVCTSETGKSQEATLENLITIRVANEPLVLWKLFPPPRLKCSLGGAESGECPWHVVYFKSCKSALGH